MVKASDEDIRHLHGDEPIEDVARRWLQLGPALAWSPEGSTACTRPPDLRQQIALLAHRVVNTIRAGDSVMAALIAQLVELGSDRRSITDAIDALPSEAPSEVLDVAAAAAAITVSRAGAEPPTRADLPLLAPA